MFWLLIDLFVWSVGLLIELFCICFFGHVSLGILAFRPGPDGRFSKLQIVGQIALIGLPAILCLWVLFLCIADFARRLLNA